MRKFKLRNAAGYEYDLTETAHFLYDPSGLGFAYKSKYRQIDQQFVQISEVLEQPCPAGTMKFNDYIDYTNFIKFIQRRPIVLFYMPENEEYRLDCKVTQLEKTEKGKGGWLNCNIKFEGFGSWYKYKILRTDLQTVGKTYDYTYPYGYTDTALGCLKIVLQSNVRSPSILTFLGPCNNPAWVHYVNGREVTTGKINAEIEEGERLSISSLIPYAIRKTDNAGVELEDLYGKSDFATKRFVWLEMGENSIVISHESTDNLKAILEVYEYYESV